MILLENEIKNFTLPDHARVWIFQAERFLDENEANAVREKGKKFAAQWRAHGKELTAEFEIVHDLFLIMAIDEKMENASGCSIDTFMAFVLEAERNLGISFTNRLCFAWQRDQELNIAKASEIKSIIAENQFDNNTLVFDNLVSNLGDLRTNWLKPASQLWLNRYFI